ncbi:MAG: guanosine-3',5'-bis(diphosphate) 3'-pyrophosphohydrolase, partial [Limisphaerales bacterium]
LVPISHVLENGNQVQIITSKTQKPSEGWLNFLVTPRARQATKSALKVEKKNTADEGKAMVKRKFKSMKINYDEHNINFLLRYYRMPTSMEFFYGVAVKDIKLPDLKRFENIHGKLTAPKKDQKEKELRAKVTKTAKIDTDLLLFEDFDGQMKYQFAQCCNPIVGEDIFGFITVEGMVKVHRTNCSNAMNMMSKYGYRIVKTRWTRQKELAIPINLKVIGLDGTGLIQAITSVISDKLAINMQALNIEAKEGIFEGHITLSVLSTDQVQKLIDELKSVDGVIGVDRLLS